MDQIQTTRVSGPKPSSNGEDERSVGALMRDLSSDSMHLIRQEAQLFRVETSQKLAKVQRETAVLGAGGVIAHTGALVLAAALVLLLAEAMAAWIAALIVGAALVIAGAIALVTGKNKLAREEVAPKETVRSVTQDIRTIREAWR